MIGDNAWIALQRVGYRYGGDVALEGVDLELSAGERLVVVGPNGGGKSTLLRLLLGLLVPSHGRIVRLARHPPLRLGYVPQFPAFDRSFPLRVEEVVLDGRLHRRPRFGSYGADDRAAAAGMLDRLDLGSLRRAYLTELSGGELKRALLARALLGEPEILVLDEPTASLDAASRAALWRLVTDLPATSCVVLATHDLAPGTFAATRALRIDRTASELDLTHLHEPALLCGHGDA